MRASHPLGEGACDRLVAGADGAAPRRALAHMGSKARRPIVRERLVAWLNLGLCGVGKQGSA